MPERPSRNIALVVLSLGLANLTARQSIHCVY